MTSFFDDLPDIPENYEECEYKNDPREFKINSTIGMIYNEDGSLMQHPFIKEIEKELVEAQLDKEYTKLQGLPDYYNQVFKIFFNQEYSDGGNFYAGQSVTGGSALRICSDVIKNFLTDTIYVSNLTFSFYYDLFSKLNIQQYPYYNSSKKNLDFIALIDFLNNIPDNSAINLQLSNHNPTGIDFSSHQWDDLAEVFKKKNHFALFDCAYLGLASGTVEGDIYGLRKFQSLEIEFLLAFSSAKCTRNYSDDVGGVIAWLKDPKSTSNLQSLFNSYNRGFYSLPSLQGARIFTKIFKEKREEFDVSLKNTVEHLNLLREKIVNTLKKKGVKDEFISFLNLQKGIYMFLDLLSEQLNELKIKYAIYLGEHGRVNLTSINSKNIEYFCECISKII